jgi:hypothetical protein
MCIHCLGHFSPILVIFDVGAHIYALASLDCDPSAYASHISGMTGNHLHT